MFAAFAVVLRGGRRGRTSAQSIGRREQGGPDLDENTLVIEVERLIGAQTRDTSQHSDGPNGDTGENKDG